MTRETMQTLNHDTLIGFTDKRGTAWHYREDLQGDEPNHYPGPIPVDDVRRRLFNWSPLEADVVARFSDGHLVTDPTRKAIVRSDTGRVLGIFKQSYRVHEYDEWLVRNVENLLDDDLAVGSAGLLKGGAVAWVQIEVPETMEVAGVTFRPNLTAATSLDGSLVTTYKRSSQVTVCDNTLSADLGERHDERFKVRHSSRSLMRLNDVRDALGIVVGIGETFAAQIEALTGQKVTKRQWTKFLDLYVPTDGVLNSKRGMTIALNKRADLESLYASDDRVAPWAGTAYGVLAAVNTYTHHFGTVRNMNRAERNMERAVTGKVDDLDRSTLDTLATVLA